MKNNISLLTLSILATGIVTAGRFVGWGGAHSGAGGDAAGVAQADTAVGSLIPTDVLGTAVVETGGVFAKHDLITSDATGRAVLAAGAASTTRTAVIAGAVAGDLVVAGIATTDVLVGVIRLDRDASAANVNLASLKTEFTITAANTINNVGGTSTAGDTVLVIWETRSVRARALEASSGAGQFVEAYLYPA